MLLIKCPWCEQRDELEFSCGGEAHLGRPEPTDRATTKKWADYLFYSGTPIPRDFTKSAGSTLVAAERGSMPSATPKPIA